MKKRTLDEYRQTKEYQLKDGRKSFDPEFNDLVDRVMPEEIEEIRNKLNYTLNEQMQEIAERVKDTVYDIIFQEIIDVMDNYDELNWGYFIQDDAPTALIDACMDHKTEIHYEIFQLVLQKLK
jgi:hypothetical protein